MDDRRRLTTDRHLLSAICHLPSIVHRSSLLLRLESWGPVTRLRLTRTIFGRPVYWVSAYSVDGLLIDTGPHRTRREIVAAARDLHVRQVFITHQHEDHSGGASTLYHRLGLVPQAGVDTAPFLQTSPRIHLYRALVWGRAEGTPAQAVTEIVTDHYHFNVIPTPGHSPDHTVLYEPSQGWVFGGDLFIHEHAKYLRADEDLPALEQSLRRVAALNAAVLFCGHAGVVEGPSAAIQRKLDYWEQVRVQARDLQLLGQSLPAIRTAVLGPEGPLTRYSRGHLSKLNLIRALLAA